MTNSGVSSPTSPAASPRRRFVLTGHSAPINPAVDVVRDDLADVELADRVFAPHYARGLRYTVSVPVIVHLKASEEAAGVTDIAAGDVIEVFDFNGGWAWVRTPGGVGYVRAEAVMAL